MTNSPTALALVVLLALPAALGAQPGVEAGRRAFEARDYVRARQELAAGYRAQPSAAAAYYLGRIELGEGDGAGAAEWMERAVEREPRSAEYQYYLGAAYGRWALRAGRLRQATVAPKARAALERAVALDPNHLDARAALMQYFLVAPGIAGGSVDKAAQQAREIGRRDPLRGHVAAGSVAEARKDRAGAEREYQAAVAAAPDSVGPYVALGDFYRRGGQADRAFATFEQLLRRRPDALAAHYFIGRVAATSGQRMDAGERSLQRYIQSRPGPADPPLASAHFRLGQLYERQGRKELARAQYEATLRLDPSQGEARDAMKRVR